MVANRDNGTPRTVVYVIRGSMMYDKPCDVMTENILAVTTDTDRGYTPTGGV